jgi:uncharacterized repeat protein (TIGR01451 family)/LPXTG-motif cell wall-anchored protein
MPTTWLPIYGVHRRLFYAALAVLVALSTLAIIPGTAAPAYGAPQEDVVELGQLDIEKSTNGEDADTAPGPYVRAGDPVVWTYVVTNTGTLSVYGIEVTDDNNDFTTVSCTGQENGSVTLASGEAIECSSSSVSWFLVGHQEHENTATVTGYDANEAPVTATDLSHYTPTLVCPIGDAPDRIVVDIVGPTDGKLLGAPGEVPNRLGPIDAAIPAGVYSISWASYDAHDIKEESNPGQTDEVWYVAVGGVISVNTQDVPWDADYAQGTLATPLVVAADATSIMIHHGGPADTINSVHAICVAFDPLTPSIDVTKTVDKGHIVGSDTVEFTITVTNDGEVTLTDLVLEDVLGYNAGETAGLSQCETPDVTTLAPGESTTVKCTQDLDAEIHGTEVLNTITATGTPPIGPNVTDNDDVPVTIEIPAGLLAIDKLVGPLGSTVDSTGFVEEFFVAKGYDGDVTWKVTVTNPTAYTVHNLFLDDLVAPAAIPSFEAAGGALNGSISLAPGASITFVFDGPGAPTTVNVAGVIGTDLAGTPLPRVSDDARISALAASATIGDTVWNDENKNGIQDNGEKGIAGAKVKLTLPDGTTAEATTNSNGLYLFSGLDAGQYKAEVIMSSIPEPSGGTNSLTTPGSFTIQLSDGQSYLDADFGIASALPNTGISTDQIGLTALAMILAGGVALLSTRRRRYDAIDRGTAS